MIFNIKDREDITVNNYPVKIYHSFYTKPHLIFEKMLNSLPPVLHKEAAHTYNGKKFLDLRHNLHIPDLEPVVDFFEELTGQQCVHKDKNFITNMQKWFDDPFNDYVNNYWWPHKDFGYSLLIYLNEYKENGLNLYKDSPYRVEQKKHEEHVKPWHLKKNYTLLKHIKVPFNTAILFPANYLLHGCSINDDYYFRHYRLNQALFFKQHA